MESGAPFSPASLDDVPNSPPRHEPTGFILRLAKALHVNGVPAYELEQTVNACASRLGLGVQCMSTPTAITLSILQPDTLPQTFVIRAAPGEVNIEQLRRLTDVASRVIDGVTDTVTGARELKAIQRLPTPIGQLIWYLAYFVVSAALANIFGGGSREMLVAGLSGLSIAGLNHATRHSVFRHLLPALSAIAVTQLIWFFSAGLAWPLANQLTLLSGLIILLPGLSITIALAELATQNLVSGTARLFGAASILIQLTFGSIIGMELAENLWGHPNEALVYDLPSWLPWFSAACGSLALVPLFFARWRDGFWFVVAGLLAYGVTVFAQKYTTPHMAAFLSATTVGITANLASRYLALPGATVLMPGFIMLVPGAMGYRGMLAMASHDMMTGLAKGFDVILIGVSLIAGLLIASLVRLPRQEIGWQDD